MVFRLPHPSPYIGVTAPLLQDLLVSLMMEYRPEFG